MTKQASAADKERISKRAGILGIAVNLCLCILKLFLGYLTNSIAIISDGFNNLSDIGNAILIFVGYRLASKPADKQHPYGHGRLEYMLSQAIAIMVMLVGISLLRVSAERLIHPEKVISNGWALFALIFSLAVKIMLSAYYNSLYRKTAMEPFKAQKVDSLADSAGITVIIIGYLIAPITDLPVDSVIGIAVSLLIVYGGFKIFRDNTSILLGQPLDDDMVSSIAEIISQHPEVQGVHDLRLHSYGQDNVFGSGDVELNSSLSLMEAHNILDMLEQQIYEQFQIQMTLHADPVVRNEKTKKYCNLLDEALKSLDPDLGYHDFHYNESLRRYLVDIDLPFQSKLTEQQVKEHIEAYFREKKSSIKLEIRISQG